MKHERRDWTWFPGVLLLLVGLVLSIALTLTDTVKSDSFRIPVDGDRAIVARIYAPRFADPPYPAMILCHGVNNHKGMMAPLALELARVGIAAIAFDFGGYGESYELPVSDRSVEGLQGSTNADARTVLKFARSRPDLFEGDRLAIGGHSLGGLTALQVGRSDPRLRATVVLSASGDATLTAPTNLFLGVGAYEQINPPSQLRQTLQLATSSDCADGEICGDFANGTARQLVVSPTSDHIIAPYDPILMRSVVRWTQQSLGVSSRDRPLMVPGYIVGLFCTFNGAVLTGIWIFARTAKPVTLPQLHQLYRRIVTILMGVLVLLIWGLAASGGAPTRGARNNLLLCLFLQLGSNYVLSQPRQFLAIVRAIVLYGLLILVAFFLPAIACGATELFNTPMAWFRLPQFFVQWSIFTIYNYTQFLQQFLFPLFTFQLQVSWVFASLVALEIFFPSIVLNSLERVITAGIAWLRRPFRLSGVGRISKRAIALISVLLVIFGTVIARRLSDGLLAIALTDSALMLRQLGLLLALPLAFAILVVRSRWFQRLERIWIGSTRNKSDVNPPPQND